MKFLHAKSGCCRAKVRGFGKRRRQCKACGRTWTQRPRKRGRPAKRIAQDKLAKVLLKGYPLRHFARWGPAIKPGTQRYHLRRAMRAFVAKPRRLEVPEGPLVLLLDGLWASFGRQPWVLYQVAFKPCQSKTATFLDPVLLPGKEGARNWERVLDQLPETILSKVMALVVDNLGGLKGLAERRGWALQLCHFHLLLKFYGRQRMLRHALRGGKDRVLIHELVRRVLAQPGGPDLERDLQELKALSDGPAITARLRSSIRDLLANINFYRTYLARPIHGLPTTTNSIESMGAQLRRILHRHKASSSPRSMLLWATAFTRLRPHVICNGSINRID